jgi:3-oxoacyl-[acyl-carrier protein] reductase
VNAQAPHEGCALVTGGSRGIGAATAQALAAAGWPVVVNYRADRDGAVKVARTIAAQGGTARIACADVSDGAAVETMFAQAEQAFGRVLVLVNNAGIRADNLLAQIDLADWTTVLDTNLRASYLTMHRAIPTMVRARFGRIVNVASVVGMTASPGQANYAAAKAGLIGLTKTVAAEVARRRVTVNAVAPGLVRTRLTEQVADGLTARIPARRAGSAEEIAACVGFLASVDASYVTGAVLVADGGLSA